MQNASLNTCPCGPQPAPQLTPQQKKVDVTPNKKVDTDPPKAVRLTVEDDPAGVGLGRQSPGAADHVGQALRLGHERVAAGILHLAA